MGKKNNSHDVPISFKSACRVFKKYTRIELYKILFETTKIKYMANNKYLRRLDQLATFDNMRMWMVNADVKS